MFNRIAKRYGKDSNLQKPENTILNICKNDLKNMTMLDIGVGGGRTSLHFMPLVKQYVAIDYSEEMIQVCKKRFPEHKDQFKIADVRDLSAFDESSFDFVLFSFNGIDYISHQDRIKAFSEIKRVLKTGGVFVFSSHNLQSDTLSNINYSFNPVKSLESIIKSIYIKLSNSNIEILRQGGYALIKDGGHFFKLKNYYIKPQAQISQLSELGFSDIKLYSLYSGEEIISGFEAVKDPWLYYTCIS